MLILQVGCKARKQDCYEHFIGPQGRNKEMKLFYCFMKWDNKDIDWTTNILPTGVGSSSCAVPKVDLSGEDFEPGDNVRVHYRINICASFFFFTLSLFRRQTWKKLHRPHNALVCHISYFSKITICLRNFFPAT